MTLPKNRELGDFRVGMSGFFLTIGYDGLKNEPGLEACDVIAIHQDNSWVEVIFSSRIWASGPSDNRMMIFGVDCPRFISYSDLKTLSEQPDLPSIAALWLDIANRQPQDDQIPLHEFIQILANIAAKVK